jgi:Protein of unknown function (DUF1203)
MHYQISGLAPQQFSHLFGLSETALAELGVRRMRVDAYPGFPDRVSLTDLPVGANALLLNFTHLDVASAYRSSHAIFIQEYAQERLQQLDALPEALRRRMLSIRAFDTEHWMLDAELVAGSDADTVIKRLLSNTSVAYLHLHFAIRGCFAARIERAN